MSEEKRRILILNYDSKATKHAIDIFSQHCDVTTFDSLEDVAEKADEDFDIIISGYVIPSVSGDKPVSYLQNIQKAIDEAKLAVQEKRDGNEALLGESQKKWDEILKLLNDHIRVTEEADTARKHKEEAEKKAEAILKEKEDAEKKAEAALMEKTRTEEELGRIRAKDTEVIDKLNDEVNTLTEELENSISVAEETHKEKANIEKKLAKLQENWEKYVAGQ
ncbi:MAG: hypothetical protein JRF08_00105 [Deltaproteobacteria bacterium]|nr:hypothetical protein [Deltaproteobacteria bacterium]